MKENIEFSENAIKDAKQSLRAESAAVKRLQKQLDDKRAQQIKISEECCSLKKDMQEMKIQLQRSRALTVMLEKKAEHRSESKMWRNRAVSSMSPGQLNAQNNGQ